MAPDPLLSQGIGREKHQRQGKRSEFHRE
jgi:hypothetical protein